MEKVLKLAPQPTPEEMDIKDALATIDDMRERIVSGEIIGFAVAAIKPDGKITTAWTSGCGRDKFRTMGAVACLTARLYKSVENPEW